MWAVACSAFDTSHGKKTYRLSKVFEQAVCKSHNHCDASVPKEFAKDAAHGSLSPETFRIGNYRESERITFEWRIPFWCVSASQTESSARGLPSFAEVFSLRGIAGPYVQPWSFDGGLHELAPKRLGESLALCKDRCKTGVRSGTIQFLHHTSHCQRQDLIQRLRPDRS